MRAPTANAATQRVLNARILIQSQETIGAKIDDFFAGDLNDPVRPHAIDDHVFHVRGREQLGEMLNEANQTVLCRALANCCIGEELIRTFFSTLWGVNPPGLRRRCETRKRAYQTKNDESEQAQSS